MLNNKTYDVLKWIGLIACPAIAAFIGGLFPVWNLPYGDAITTTINLIGTLIGALLGFSTSKYNKSK